MKKVIIPVAAVAATLALGGNAMAGGEKLGDKAKFDSDLSLNYSQGAYDEYDPYYEEATFSGQVTVSPANVEAENRPEVAGKCLKKRIVTIKNLDLPRGLRAYAQVRTDNTGFYSVTASDEYAQAGTYRARVNKKRKVKAEIKCSAAKSNEVEVPTPDEGS